MRRKHYVLVSPAKGLAKVSHFPNAFLINDLPAAISTVAEAVSARYRAMAAVVVDFIMDKHKSRISRNWPQKVKPESIPDEG